MTTTVTKGLVVRSDFQLYDGKYETVNRRDSTGGTINSLPINDFVDVLSVYGSGSEYTVVTIISCVNNLGSRNRTLLFRQGTWEISDNLTVASNFTSYIPAGCVFNVASGKTLTFSGPVMKESYTWTSGSGTVVANEWLTPSAFMATVLNDANASAAQVTLDVPGRTNIQDQTYVWCGTATGTADVIVLTPSPAITAYTAGQRFVFISSGTNTTNVTVNISTQGAKALTKYGSTALVANDITSGQICEINYDGTRFQLTGQVKTLTSPVLGGTVTGTYTLGGTPTITSPVINSATGIGQGIAKRKTADESVTSSTTLQDDDHLTFAIAANEEWVANFYLDAGAGLSSTGIKLAITGPSGVTLNIMLKMIAGDATVAYRQTTTSGNAMQLNTALLAGTSLALIQIDVWALNNTTAGNITLQWAQDTSSGTATTLRKGSFMVPHRIA